ncbi:MAG: RNA polymerase sigma factor [Novipirellula sp. JB048]
MRNNSICEAMEVQLERIKPVICRLSGGEDLHQAVCVKCIERYQGRDWNRPQYAFLRQLARTTSIDFYRRSQVRSSVWIQTESIDAIARTRAPADELLKAERSDAIRQAVDELPESYRTAVISRYFDDLPPSEIARALGVSVHTVQTRLKRARQQLRYSTELQKHADAAARD